MGRADPAADRPGPRFLAVGHLSKAHGTKGELFVRPLTDHPEGVYVPGVVLRMGDDQPDLDVPPIRIEAVRSVRDGFLVSFGGVEDRSRAELLRGRYLFREAEALEPLAEGELFYHDLLGMSVVTVDGVEVGRVTEVYELQPAHLLEVRGEGREHLIPLRKELVVQLDVDSRRLVIDPPEGLLDL
jgi:16S rRNA processing protein RimM